MIFHRDAEFSGKIHNILLRDWDPIGVRSFSEANDEYDSYINDILVILAKGGGVDEIFNFLVWAETDHMGLTADKEKSYMVALKLANLARS